MLSINPHECFRLFKVNSTSTTMLRLMFVEQFFLQKCTPNLLQHSKVSAFLNIYLFIYEWGILIKFMPKSIKYNVLDSFKMNFLPQGPGFVSKGGSSAGAPGVSPLLKLKFVKAALKFRLHNTYKHYCNQHAMFTICILFFTLTTKA